MCATISMCVPSVCPHLTARTQVCTTGVCESGSSNCVPRLCPHRLRALMCAPNFLILFIYRVGRIFVRPDLCFFLSKPMLDLMDWTNSFWQCLLAIKLCHLVNFEGWTLQFFFDLCWHVCKRPESSKFLTCLDGVSEGLGSLILSSFILFDHFQHHIVDFDRKGFLLYY